MKEPKKIALKDRIPASQRKKSLLDPASWKAEEEEEENPRQERLWS